MTNATIRRTLTRREYRSTALNAEGVYHKRDRRLRCGIRAHYATIQRQRPWRAHAVAFRHFPLLLNHGDVNPAHAVLRKRILRRVR